MRRGMEPYRRSHQWHARHTPMTLQDSRHRVMKPAAAKDEHEVAHRLEEWSVARVGMAGVGRGYPELPCAWNIAAFRGAWVGAVKEHIDLNL